MADDLFDAGTWSHRYFQPVVLRRSAGGASSLRNSQEPKDAFVPGRQEHMGRPIRRYPLLRTAHDTKRNRHPKILSESFEEGAKGAFSGAAGASRKELEV